MKRLGTRKTLSIDALSPILANILGTVLMNETLQMKSWIGASIVTLSLIGIISDKRNRFKGEIVSKSNDSLGVFFAVISVLCAVLAAILSRLVLITSNLMPFQTTEIRLLGAILFLLPVSRVNFNYIFYQISIENKLKIFIATLLGTNIGILLQQTVFHLLPIGIGWTILSVSPVVSVIFAKMEGELITWISVVFAVTTVLGVAIAII